MDNLIDKIQASVIEQRHCQFSLKISAEIIYKPLQRFDFSLKY